MGEYLLLAHITGNQKVGDSNPPSSTVTGCHVVFPTPRPEVPRPPAANLANLDLLHFSIRIDLPVYWLRQALLLQSLYFPPGDEGPPADPDGDDLVISDPSPDGGYALPQELRGFLGPAGIGYCGLYLDS